MQRSPRKGLHYSPCLGALERVLEGEWEMEMFEDVLVRD